MNELKQNYIKELLGLILLLFKIFLPSNKLKILSLYFHNPSRALFEKIVKYLLRKDYRIISLNQFIEIINKKQLHEKIALITIDDGWKDNYYNAFPLLKNRDD